MTQGVFFDLLNLLKSIDEFGHIFYNRILWFIILINNFIEI